MGHVGWYAAGGPRRVGTRRKFAALDRPTGSFRPLLPDGLRQRKPDIANGGSLLSRLGPGAGETIAYFRARPGTATSGGRAAAVTASEMEPGA